MYDNVDPATDGVEQAFEDWLLFDYDFDLCLSSLQIGKPILRIVNKLNPFTRVTWTVCET